MGLTYFMVGCVSGMILTAMAVTSLHKDFSRELRRIRLLLINSNSRHEGFRQLAKLTDSIDPDKDEPYE